MSLNVQVISTDFRRATVKVNQGTFLIDVLEEACKKLNLSSDKYLLKHKNKQLELANPIRAYNLSPGAKLELVVKSSSPSVVTVALKLPDAEAKGIPNGRLVEKFRSDTTLWKMLRHFESSGGQHLNFTARGVPQGQGGGLVNSGSGQLYYEGPALLVVGRELSSLADLQKTLSQLGISGNVLMNLSFKINGLTLHEAMQEMEQFFKSEGAESAAAPGAAAPKAVTEWLESSSPSTAEQLKGAVSPAQSSQDQDTSSSVDVNMDGESDQSSQPAPSKTPVSAAATTTTSRRPVQVFAAPTSSTPAAALTEEPDTAYHPSIAHAQLHQHRLQESSHNKRLPSDEEIERKAAVEAARLAAIREVSVKVRFPDNTSAQWTFGAQDTAASLYTEVRAVMADPSLRFKLVSPAASRPELRDSAEEAHRLVKGYRLAGRVVATLVWDDSVPAAARRAPFLREAAARQARQIQVPLVTAGRDDDDGRKGGAGPAQGRGSGGGEGSSGVGGVKLPKWLKLPGKK